MQEMSIEAGGQLVATIRVGTIVREAVVTRVDDGGLVSVEFGALNVGIRLIGPPEVVADMLCDAERQMAMVLRERRGLRSPPELA
jgi:hypothetical protein